MNVRELKDFLASFPDSAEVGVMNPHHHVHKLVKVFPYAFTREVPQDTLQCLGTSESWLHTSKSDAAGTIVFTTGDPLGQPIAAVPAYGDGEAPWKWAQDIMRLSKADRIVDFCGFTGPGYVRLDNSVARVFAQHPACVQVEISKEEWTPRKPHKFPASLHFEALEVIWCDGWTTISVPGASMMRLWIACPQGTPRIERSFPVVYTFLYDKSDGRSQQ